MRKHQDVAPSSRLRVDEAIPASGSGGTKNLLVETQRARSVSNRAS